MYLSSCSTNSHTFSSLSSTGTHNSVFSAARPADQLTPPANAEQDRTSLSPSAAEAPQSSESVGNSSFGEDSSTTPVPIGQQKATAILPEILPVTGELHCTNRSYHADIQLQYFFATVGLPKPITVGKNWIVYPMQ